MEKDKITFLNEKKFKEKARKDAEFLENKFAENPISAFGARISAFQKLKREITIKDLF